MSLINRMLLDLDRRRASPAGALPAQVRTPPAAARPMPWRSIGAGILVGAVSGLMLWGWYGGAFSPAQDRRASSPRAPAIPVVPPAVPVARAPAQTVPAPPSPALEPPVARAASPKAAHVPETVPARTELRRAPVAPAAKPRAVPAQPVERRDPAPAAGVPAADVPASSLPEAGEASAASAQPLIEKRLRLATPRARAEHQLRKADAAMRVGRTDEAIEALRAALREDASHALARRKLADTLLEHARAGEALAVLREGLSAEPGQAMLAVAAARELAIQGRTAEAIEILGAGAAAGADTPELHGLYAALLQRVDRHEQAVAEYRAALRGIPDAAAWWVGLGVSLEALGRAAQAQDSYRRSRATGTLSPELAAFVEGKLGSAR